jgi:hypothetical protein
VPEDLYRTSADAYLACLAGMLVEVAGMEDALTLYRIHGANSWLASGGGASSEQQKLTHYIGRFEMENGGLNDALWRLGSPLRASTRDHFAYQLYLCRSGRADASLGRLLWLMVRDPSEWRVRLGMVAGNASHLLRAAMRPSRVASSPSPPYAGERVG